MGELKLRIVHCLLAHEKAGMDTITVVRSHEQGMAQCGNFLDKYPSWHRETYPSTAGAAASIGGAAHIAAIAGEEAAKAFGLKILKVGIENNPLNYTRFVIISRRIGDTIWTPPILGKPNKASLVFSAPDKPGSLFECLKILSEGGINLSKLESRPIHGQPWRYLFYVDVSVPETEGIFKGIIESLKLKTEDFRFLGTYRASL